MSSPQGIGVKTLFLSLFFFLTACSFTILYNPAAYGAGAESKLGEIQEKLSSKLDELKAAAKKEKSVSAKLKNLNKTINKKEKELKNYNRRINRTKVDISTLSAQIDDLTGKLEDNIQYLEQVVTTFYKQQYDSNALILLSASDYQDLVQKMKYTSLVAHYDSTVLNQYSEEIKKINKKKAELESLQASLQETASDARNKRNKLYKESQNKDRLLAKLKAERVKHEKNIKELEESSKKVQGMLKGIKSAALPRSISGKGFNKLKGKLPWPVRGEVLKKYAKNKKLDSATTALNSGIEIKTGASDKPGAVAGGRVVYAGSFKGYKNLVIIDHGSGYHSLYGNLSEVTLEKGNIVIEGFEVGKIKKTKSTGAPTLYFEIRHRGKPVDPVKWLKKMPVRQSSS